MVVMLAAQDCSLGEQPQSRAGHIGSLSGVDRGIGIGVGMGMQEGLWSGGLVISRMRYVE